MGERSSTDFGMDFGGGVNFGAVYAELRYHYIWGPEVQIEGPGGNRCPACPAIGRPTASSSRRRSASASSVVKAVRSVAARPAGWTVTIAGRRTTMTSTHGKNPDPAPSVAVADAGRLWHRAEHYVRRKLVWNNVYRATSYLRSALWVIPFLAIVLVLAIAPALRMLDAWLGWRLPGLGVAGAQALYQTVITLTLSFIVFTFGSLLVAIQVAGGQLTPRIIATTLLRDNVVRYSVGLFVFTLIFAVMALDRLENDRARDGGLRHGRAWASPAWRRSCS